MNPLRNQKGGSLIEFVIIAPLLFLILFGIIEFGILLYDKAMITNASREGARFGIVFDDPRRSDGEIITVVRDYCAAHLISFGGGTLPNPTITRTLEPSGDTLLTVTVNYPFQFLVLSNLAPLIGADINLRAETVMRME